MKKTARFLTTLVLIFMLAPAFAKHSDAFILGTYSYISNHGKAHEREAMYGKMRELSYNSNLAETFVDNADFDAMMKEMDAWELDVWITDKTWNPDSTSNNASYALSTGNFIRFEAEYANESELNPGDGWDSSFWYSARSDKYLTRKGKPQRSPDASNGWVWQAKKGRDGEGWLFTDLRYRWPNQNDAYVRIGKEFLLQPIKNADRAFIHVKFRFKIGATQKNLANDAALLNFSLCGYEYSKDGFSDDLRILTHFFEGRQQTVTSFRLSDLQPYGSGEFIELELKVPYSALLDANLMKKDYGSDPKGMMRLVNLNPRVWWHGNCDVKLDWVSIEDQIYRDLQGEDGSKLRADVLARMKNLQDRSPGNLTGFYLMDEPRMGEFSTHNLLQSEAQKEGIPVFAAVYDYLYPQISIDEKSGIYYDHVEAFFKSAEPDIIAPDIYPLVPNLKWSPSDSNPGIFIQDQLEQKMIPVYLKSMVYRDEAEGRSFMPIVQVLGSWVQKDEGDHWQTWIQPPTATQKVLLYLPLCFAPDGIFHYRFREFQNPEGYGNRAGTFSRVGDRSYPAPIDDPVSWPALFYSNPRVLEYGQKLKNLTWLGTEVIGTANSKGKKWYRQTMMKSAQVQKRKNGDYEGWVQCAWYQDSAENPWFMVVNRRGNYFRPVAASEPSFVAPGEYEISFPEAEPQFLILKFDKRKLAAWGENPALFDPYEETLYPIVNNQAQILLPAGEGRLLQLVKHKDL